MSWSDQIKQLKEELEKVNNYIHVDVPELFKRLYAIPQDVRYDLLKTPGTSGNTVLQDAAFDGHTDLTKMLINSVDAPLRVVLIEQQNSHRNTALDLAAINNHNNIISILLNSVGCNDRVPLLSKQKSLGTALHTAASKGHVNSIEAIMSTLTADQQKQLLQTPNTRGQFALDLAQMCNKPEAIQALQEQTAQSREREREQDLHERVADLEIPQELKHQDIAEILSDFGQRIEVLESENTQLKTDKIYTEYILADLEKQQLAFNIQMDVNAVLTDKLKEQKERIKSLEKCRQKDKDDINQLNAAIETMCAKLDNQEEVCSQLKVTVAEVNTKVSDGLTKAEVLEGEQISLRKSSEGLKADVAHLNKHTGRVRQTTVTDEIEPDSEVFVDP